MNQPAGGYFLNDVVQAVVGVAGRRSIVKGEKDPRESLNQKQKKGNAAEDLVPTTGVRYLLVKEVPNRGFESRAVFDPFHESSLQHTHTQLSLRICAQAPTKDCCPPVSPRSGPRAVARDRRQPS